MTGQPNKRNGGERMNTNSKTWVELSVDTAGVDEKIKAVIDAR